MAIIGFDHVQVAMPLGGEAAAVDFYAGVLGMTQVPKPPQLEARGGCWFAAGDAVIHVGVETEFHPARKAHPALLIDDLDSLVGTLEAEGFPTEPGILLDGYPRCDVHDPFGNRIELMEKTT